MNLYERAQRIHRRTGEMIALDFQAFSMADDQGFRQQIKETELHTAKQKSEYRIGIDRHLKIGNDRIIGKKKKKNISVQL